MLTLIVICLQLSLIVWGKKAFSIFLFIFILDVIGWDTLLLLWQQVQKRVPLIASSFPATSHKAVAVMWTQLWWEKSHEYRES